MSLLEYDIIKKGWISNKKIVELDANNYKEYIIEVIKDSIIYTREVVENQLLKLYYLIF